MGGVWRTGAYWKARMRRGSVTGIGSSATRTGTSRKARMLIHCVTDGGLCAIKGSWLRKRTL